MMRPPKVAPKSLLTNFGMPWFDGRKNGRAFVALSMWYSYSDP